MNFYTRVINWFKGIVKSIAEDEIRFLKKVASFGRAIYVTSLIFYVCYNFYFGWNIRPENEYEKLFDDVFKNIFDIGLLLYILPAAKIYSSFIDDND